MIVNDAQVWLTAGDTDDYATPVTEADVALFALVTGDTHPLHLDPTYAASTQFARPTVPVGLITGLVEAALKQRLPGYRGIICRQILDFPTPAFVDDQVTVRITLTHIDTQSAVCQVNACTEGGVTVATGTVHLRIEPLPPLPLADDFL